MVGAMTFPVRFCRSGLRGTPPGLGGKLQTAPEAGTKAKPDESGGGSMSIEKIRAEYAACPFKPFTIYLASGGWQVVDLLLIVSIG
jgi:hypothetical protein